MNEFGIYRGDKILKRHQEKVVLIDNILWAEDNILLLGNAKVGKSILALQMACNLTSGEPFLDIFDIPKPVEVLYIQAEGKRYETQDRLESMMKGAACDMALLSHIYLPGMALDTPAGIELIEGLISRERSHPKVIIIDPLYMSISGDIKDARVAKAFIENVRKLASQFNASVITIHHKHRAGKTPFGKEIEEGDKGYYGAFAWEAAVDHILMLNFDKREKRHSLTCDTQRSAQIREKIDFVLSEDPLLFTVAEKGLNSTSMRVYNAINEEDGGGISPEALMGVVSLSRSSLYCCLRQLMASKKVKKVGKCPVMYVALK